MRILSRTVAFLAVSGCMSNNAGVQKNAPLDGEARPLAASPEMETASPSSSIAIETGNSNPESGTASKDELARTQEALQVNSVVDPGANKAQEPTAEAEKTPCDDMKKDYPLPYFIKETSTLVVGLNQKCKEAENKAPSLTAQMSVVGVACTGAPGLITRRGHDSQNWEVVSFGMDLGCNMRSAEEVRVLGKKKLGIDSDPHIVSFVPMMIEYWEFEKNNDAGLSSTPTLTASGGGAAQWKKGDTKSLGFPIKLYGHSSTITKDQAIYEARAVLMPKSNQRQFEVLVQEMKLLNPDELKVTLDRCLTKTKLKSGCNEAFDNQ